MHRHRAIGVSDDEFAFSVVQTHGCDVVLRDIIELVALCMCRNIRKRMLRARPLPCVGALTCFPVSASYICTLVPEAVRIVIDTYEQHHQITVNNTVKSGQEINMRQFVEATSKKVSASKFHFYTSILGLNLTLVVIVSPSPPPPIVAQPCIVAP